MIYCRSQCHCQKGPGYDSHQQVPWWFFSTENWHSFLSVINTINTKQSMLRGRGQWPPYGFKNALHFRTRSLKINIFIQSTVKHSERSWDRIKCSLYRGVHPRGSPRFLYSHFLFRMLFTASTETSNWLAKLLRLFAFDSLISFNISSKLKFVLQTFLLSQVYVNTVTCNLQTHWNLAISIMQSWLGSLAHPTL